MDMTKLTMIVSLLCGLSIASERLVEITKGLIPWLDRQRSNDVAEGRRRAMLHLLAVVSGVVTALLASPMIPEEVSKAYGDNQTWSILALGLLASGGSGFWNAILGYVTRLKDIKKFEAEQKRRDSGDVSGYPNLTLGEEQVTSNECYEEEN